MDDSISNFLMVDECLLDARRVDIFKKSIIKVVKPYNIVVDAGTGTGIMAMFAAKYGAKKVYAIERDPEIAVIARDNVLANKMGGKIDVINKDIREFTLPDGLAADVLIMEMLDTGMVAEQQARALIALKKNGVINDKTILLPEKIDSLVRVVDYDFDFYGFDIPLIIQARNYGVTKRIKSRLSDLHSYSLIDFKTIASNIINITVDVRINKSGTINAIELKSNIYLAGKKYADTSDMNMPVIVPVKRSKVTRGGIVRLKIRYAMGDGFSTLKANIIKFQPSRK